MARSRGEFHSPMLAATEVEKSKFRNLLLTPKVVPLVRIHSLARIIRLPTEHEIDSEETKRLFHTYEVEPHSPPLNRSILSNGALAA
jgi:hypothetical protein